MPILLDWNWNPILFNRVWIRFDLDLYSIRGKWAYIIEPLSWASLSLWSIRFHLPPSPSLSLTSSSLATISTTKWNNENFNSICILPSWSSRCPIYWCTPISALFQITFLHCLLQLTPLANTQSQRVGDHRPHHDDVHHAKKSWPASHDFPTILLQIIRFLFTFPTRSG